MTDNLRDAGAEWLDGLRIEHSGDPVLAVLEREVLPRYLLERRWYGAKDAGLPRVSFESVLRLGGPESRYLVCTLRVEPPGQVATRYLLPLAWVRDDGDSGIAPIARVSAGDESGALVDGFLVDGFVRELLKLVCDPEAHSRSNVALRAHRSAALRGPASKLVSAEIHRAAVEQSNTSLRIGEAAMLKGLRRLVPGAHPELEMGRFLTDVAGFRNTPALLGSLEIAGPKGDVTSLCVMQELVPNEGDGWSYILDQLARAASAGGTSAQTPAPLLQLAERLGRRTADLHRALSTETDDPAFAPEEATAATLAAWSDAARHMAETALNSLQRHMHTLSGPGRDAADALLSRRSALLEMLGTLIPPDARLTCTRLHGDYHLGQVLVTNDDVFIIDFEGEPLRTLEERRAKHCSLRDVAGMLRSIAYAGAAATRGGRAPGASDVIARCTDDVADMFLRTYQSAIAGCAAYPQSPDVAKRLTQLFLLEKACYEIAYEIANRPDWVDIPVSGVLALLDTAPSR